MKSGQAPRRGRRAVAAKRVDPAAKPARDPDVPMFRPSGLLPDFTDPPMRCLIFACDADRRFELPLGETLGSYYAWRGLIGAVLTAADGDTASLLFKPGAVSRGTETPTVRWGLRLNDLYARSITRRFTLVIDLFGELPCARANVFVEAVRCAGSGQPFTDLRTGKPNPLGPRRPQRVRQAAQQGFL